MNTIEKNIREVRERVARCAAQAGKKPEDITLVCVSKTKPKEAILEAYDAGIRQFGENRVQEFLEKYDELPGDIKWNLIGQLQTNKVKYIIDKGLFLLHSLDRKSLADELLKQCKKNAVTIDALVQVNIAKEDTKSGVYEEDLEAFLEGLLGQSHIRLKGLMTIAPFSPDESYVRGIFAKTKALYDKYAPVAGSFEYLSMGMSGDFEWAILEGSNMVRVGTSIFGNRVY